MTQFSTELLNFPAQKQDIDKFFHSSLEIAMEDGIDQMVSLLPKKKLEKLDFNGDSFLKLHKLE